VNGLLRSAATPTFDWTEREGLWSTYYLTAIAECGLTFEDIRLDKEKAIHFGTAYRFEHSCGDHMRLRALVRLGLVKMLSISYMILPKNSCRTVVFFAFIG